MILNIVHVNSNNSLAKLPQKPSIRLTIPTPLASIQTESTLPLFSRLEYMVLIIN